jgi:hypothetical protein
VPAATASGLLSQEKVQAVQFGGPPAGRPEPTWLDDALQENLCG